MFKGGTFKVLRVGLILAALFPCTSYNVFWSLDNESAYSDSASRSVGLSTYGSFILSLYTNCMCSLIVTAVAHGKEM